jgi:hypothetical protein
VYSEASAALVPQLEQNLQASASGVAQLLHWAIASAASRFSSAVPQRRQKRQFGCDSVPQWMQ